MERPFLKFRDKFINLNAIAFVEQTDDGGVAVTVTNRDTPFRLDRSEAGAFLEVLARFSVPIRGQ